MNKLGRDLHTGLPPLLLAACTNPHLGRSAEELSPGLRRIRRQAHVVFYLLTAEEILIARVLHHRVDSERYRNE